MANGNSSGRFSVALCNVMGVMGYSYAHIKKRQESSEIVQKWMNQKFRKDVLTYIIVGSKKEGVSFQEVNGDLDIMYICNEVKCFQMSDSAIRSQEDGLTYLLQYEGCPPGYAMLEVDEHSNDDNETVYIRTAKTNKRYYSSEMLSNYAMSFTLPEMNKKQATGQRGPGHPKPSIRLCESQPSLYGGDCSSITDYPSFLSNLESISRNGPSMTTEYRHSNFLFKSEDKVIALPALCTDYMQQWSSRNRNHSFPTVEQIERISKMEVHVVPVGCKETPDSGLQWRICFTMGEVELIQSLNGTQLILYVLLRMLAKDVIKPECPGIITSYVMKNVVLWMAELKSRDHFREENLENCLIEAVHFLRLCVRNGFLPNYMIHSRNLLQGRLSLQDRGILLKLLGKLIQEKGKMVMRCEKVGHNLNCPYISRLSKYAGEDTQICAEIFRIFLKPALAHGLTDMEDVFAAFLLSLERGIDKQTTTVKLQIIILLKYIKTWITKLPYKSPEQIEKRSQMRRKCGDLRRRTSKSVNTDLSGDLNSRAMRSVLIDLFMVTDEQLDCLLSFNFQKLRQYGQLDVLRIVKIMLYLIQADTTKDEAQQTEEEHARQQRQYSDLDLD